MNTLIRLLYAVLIAAAVVTFVAVGIYTFYPAPKPPVCLGEPLPAKGIVEPVPGSGGAYPPVQNTPAKDNCQNLNDSYTNDTKTYQRNLSIILVVLGAAVVGLGLWLRNRSDIIGEGLALGGVGTSIYAVGTAVAADDRVMRFVAVTLFLASVLVLVYFKFNESLSKNPKARRT